MPDAASSRKAHARHVLHAVHAFPRSKRSPCSEYAAALTGEPQIKVRVRERLQRLIRQSKKLGKRSSVASPTWYRTDQTNFVSLFIDDANWKKTIWHEDAMQDVPHLMPLSRSTATRLTTGNEYPTSITIPQFGWQPSWQPYGQPGSCPRWQGNVQCNVHRTIQPRRSSTPIPSQRLVVGIQLTPFRNTW